MRIKLQIGLKWFLLVTTLIAVFAGTIGKRLYDQWQNNVGVERRARAVSELEEFGVRAHEAYHRDGKRDGVIVHIQFPYKVCKPRHFKLLAEFSDLETLELSNTGFSDTDVAILAAHPNLTRLSVPFNPALTDRGMKSVAELESLEVLELAATGITDQGLSEFARLPKLQSLHLERTAITSPGLGHLRPLQSLRALSVMFTAVDDSGLESIGELRNLEAVSLDHTKVHGPGLAALVKLPKLRVLSLRGCPLEDASSLAKLKQLADLRIMDSRIAPGILSHVHEMDSLRTLNLHGSGVSDAHLAELASAKQLTSLVLGKTNASAVALRELKAKLPNTKVLGEPRDP